MLPIYICEDNKQMLDFLSTSIQNYCLIQEYDFKVKLASINPYDILKKVKESKQRGIYFLDVDLKQDMNGFDLGIEIRKLDTRGFLTYITTHDELLKETFKHRLEVMDYIIKDHQDVIIERLKETLDHIHSYMCQHEGGEDVYFKVKSFGSIRQIPLQDILFFETSERKHVIVLHLEHEILEFNGSLQEVMDHLPNAFLRVHRSYVVNVDKIKTFDSKQLLLILQNEESCLVARNMRKEVKKYL